MQLRTLSIIAAALSPLLSHAGVGFDLPQPSLDTPPPTVQALDQQVGALNKVIGSFPIRVSTADDRQAVYRQSSAALQQAWAIERKQPRAESTDGLLADLYRQGHNLDVKRTADSADNTITLCLAASPDSIRCNFAAAYFYLSVNPKFAPKGEVALVHLRELFKPQANLEVEKGVVFAYLFEGRKDEARTQLTHFRTLDPQADWAREFPDNLDKGVVVQKKTTEPRSIAKSGASPAPWSPGDRSW